MMIKAIFILAFFSITIGCSSSNNESNKSNALEYSKNKTLVQAKKKAALNNFICEEIFNEIERVKKDTHATVKYESLDYFDTEYEGFKGGAKMALKLGYSVYLPEDISAELKSKIKEVNESDFPSASELTCTDSVSAWHEAVKMRAIEGPHQQSTYEKFEDVLKSIYETISKIFYFIMGLLIWLTISYASSVSIIRSVRDSEVFKFIVGMVLAFCFGLLGVEVSVLTNYSTRKELWLWFTAVFIITNILVGIRKKRLSIKNDN